jgi:Cu/Ag efflux protein CusF
LRVSGERRSPVRHLPDGRGLPIPAADAADTRAKEDGMRTPVVLASAAAILTLVGGPAMAQAPSTPPPRPAPGAVAVPEKPKEVEGTVKKIDTAKREVQVSSGVLGLFGATLELDDATKINVAGKDGSIADIREGAKVKASYESRDGKNVAKSIDVMPAEEATGAPPKTP